jgi:GntR family transcriptional regulator, transcriptional repressor for pyruvate dehydrogenase complex
LTAAFQRRTERQLPRSSPPLSPPPATQRDAPASGAPAFQPVRVRRGFEAVCDQIRQQVAQGTLLPGHRLPGERELAEQFGISRSGVRQALRNLELTGIGEARTGAYGGFFIKDGGTDGITQAVHDMVALGQVPPASVMEARLELTNVAIRLACARATEAQIAALEADNDFQATQLRLGLDSRNTRGVSEFYRLLARATHNEVIAMLIDALSEIVRTQLARFDAKPHEDMVKARRKVTRLLRARDADRACAAMSVHLRQVRDYFEAQTKELASEGATHSTGQRRSKSSA